MKRLADYDKLMKHHLDRDQKDDDAKILIEVDKSVELENQFEN